MIASYQEAQFLFSTYEAERCEREIALQIAQAGLQQAKQKFQNARKRLTKAEFRLGKARYFIKKHGFSDILEQKSSGVRYRPVVRASGYRTYPF
jgi:Tfp pilus assembly protein PilX